jgi:hypothetical protein
VFKARSRHWMSLVALSAGLGLAGVAAAQDPIPTPLAFYPIEPCRIFDTRTGAQGGSLVIDTLQPLPSVTRLYNVRDFCRIPPQAQALAYNLTIVRQGYAGHVVLYPSDVQMPSTSSLNFAASQVVANGGIVGLNLAPQMAVTLVMGGAPLGATADLIFDVTGYFAP